MSSHPESRSLPQRFLRLVKLLLFAAVTAALLAVGFVYWFLNSSRPHPGGTHTVAGLGAQATIAEDGYGVPRIQAASLADLLRAQGWVTARDRLFQMDLIRRKAGGELAAILGPKALPLDKEARRLGFTSVADRAIQLMDPKHRELLEAYCSGVNAYILTGPMPFEVRLLHYRPLPWRPRDTILVVLSMFQSLNQREGIDGEEGYTQLAKVYPPAVFDFMTAQFGFLDSPIQPDPAKLPLPPLPPVSDLDLRAAVTPAPLRAPTPPTAEPGGSPPAPSPSAKGPGERAALDILPDRDAALGSNAWAIAGTRTTSGLPLLAGDPHLALDVPNIWYRARLEGGGLSVTGVTLPGVPGVIIGTNGEIAWSFTNAGIDPLDLVPIEPGPDPDHFISDGKIYTFSHRQEVISIKGEAAVTLDVRETPWGPFWEDASGQAGTSASPASPPRSGWAIQWTALDPKPLSDLEVLSLDAAHTLDDAIRGLGHWSGPAQNAILATHDGHIAWVMVGKVPHRVGFDGRVSLPRDAEHYWDGYLPAEEMPRVIDPPSGLIVSANQREISVGPGMFRFGDDWPSPARAYRLGQVLSARHDWTTSEVQKVQMDVVSPTHLWYRDRLLQALGEPAGRHDPWLNAIEKLIRPWDGKASADSTAYPFMKRFRFAVFHQLLEPLWAKVPESERDGVKELDCWDGVVKRLVTEKPPSLLVPGFETYDQALRAAALQAAHGLATDPRALGTLRWGEINQTAIRHPFSRLLPRWLGRFLDMPVIGLGGDSLVPDAFHGHYGPSMRMVVDLADPAHSMFNQPGGQAGQVLSPHYGDQFAGWVTGTGHPLEPGPTVVTTVLTPLPTKKPGR